MIYIAKYDEAVYVLHAFEKRTQKMRQADIDLAKRRLTEAQRVRTGGKEAR